MLRLPDLWFPHRFVGSGPEAAYCPPIRIAVVGDSLSTGFHVSSPLVMLLQARTRNGNWVVDNTGKIYSVFERLLGTWPVELCHFAAVSAHVDAPRRRNVTDRLIRTLHMSHQVDQIISMTDFPELVVCWIGHNNLDFAAPSASRDNQTRRLSDLADETVAWYDRHIRRLLSAASERSSPVSVVIFGLIGFENFFMARQEAEEIKIRDPSQYPYLEANYRYFASLRSEHRHGMIDLANEINVRLERTARQLQKEHGSDGIRVVFSRSLHDAPINKAEMLSGVDAWHPSELGHRALAESAFPVLYREIIERRMATI